MGVVKDLFFVARIRETARMVGTPLSFARTPLELETARDIGLLRHTDFGAAHQVTHVQL